LAGSRPRAVKCLRRGRRESRRGSEEASLHEIEFGWLEGNARVRSDDAAFAAIVRRLWAAAPAPGCPVREYEVTLDTAGAATFRGPLGAQPLDRRHPAWHAYNLLMRDLLGSVGGHFVFHASALASAGRALLLAGPSNFGKTTLAVHLAFQGYSLLADDLAVVERGTGRLVPLPRSLHFRAGSRTTLNPGQLETLARAARSSGGEEWAVDPGALRAPEADPSRVAAVVLLRSEGDGVSVRRFRSHEIWLLEGHEGAADEIRELPGVRRVLAETGSPELVRVDAEDTAPLARWLREHQDIVVAAIKLPDRAPDFSKRSRAVPVGPFQASLELGQEMLNRHEGSVLAKEFRGRETHLVAEIAGLLEEARCVALWPGRPAETLELLGSVLEEPGA
jgi:hypothetical protein